MIAQLERALQEDWTDATAAVYADALIARGDPRGELIAIDLHLVSHERTDELMRRRSELVAAWLGTDGWEHIGMGFSRSAGSSIADLERLRVTPYLRTLELYDHHATLDAVVFGLGKLRLPWLRRLVLHKRQPTAVSPAALEALAEAAPYLEVLGLDGEHVLAPPLPPRVRTLELTGCTTLGGDELIRDVTAVDLRLESVYELEPLAAVRLDRFPALARLDLARNEYPYRIEDSHQYSLFPLLRDLAGANQLAHVRTLRTPALRGEADLALALGLLARLPQLSIEVARTYDYAPADTYPRLAVPAPRCWPPERAEGIRSALLVHPIDLGDSAIYVRSCIVGLEARFDLMSATEQAAWRAVWQLLADLPWTDDDEEPEVPFDARTLLVALDALASEVDCCAQFADALRALALPPGATVGIQRHWTG